MAALGLGTAISPETMVRAFGENVFDIIEAKPDRLARGRFLSPTRAIAGIYDAPPQCLDPTLYRTGKAQFVSVRIEDMEVSLAP